MIEVHARSSERADGDRKGVSGIREYPRRRYPAVPLGHRIGIKRSSGDTGRACFRLIGLGHAHKLLGKKANEECRITMSVHDDGDFGTRTWMLKRLKDMVYGMAPLKMRFDRINDKNQWGSEESVSGFGSIMSNTENIRQVLPGLFDELGVRKVVDVACGDFNWMSKVVEEAGIDYVGFDIVAAQVAENTKKYGAINVRFDTFDITSGVPSESADLVLFRDCMLHLSFAHGQAAMRNVAGMDAHWILMSTFKNVDVNIDIVSGRHRKIDVHLSPYGLPEPRRAIQENEPDKLLALWAREQLT